MEMENKLSEDSPLMCRMNGSVHDRKTSKTTRSPCFSHCGHCHPWKWNRWSVFAASTVGIVVLAIVGLRLRVLYQNDNAVDRGVNVAFVGNSMFYFNGKSIGLQTSNGADVWSPHAVVSCFCGIDFPRFFQALAGEDLVRYQDSCLHGGGDIPSLLMEGNAMYPQFSTPDAILEEPTYQMNHTIYDYGACTPEQLVTGRDIRLIDPGYAQPADKSEGNFNPCREDQTYLQWATDYYYSRGKTTMDWQYIVINDNTRDPARASSRARSMQFLEQFWAPLLRESGATPVFLWTHAYRPLDTVAHTHNMTGLEDMANFTSLTYAGLRAYVRLMTPLLPANQQPRIAPSGLAFLAVYEDDRDMWHSLFHNADHLHASPAGTFLQGLCVYHTLFGELPPKSQVVRKHMEHFWKAARMMQHAWEPPNPFPTRGEASYLYDMAKRVLVQGYVPSSFINYTHGEVAYGQA